MNWYKKAGGRGLYNQYQNDSSRQESRGYGGTGAKERDLYHENELVEGEFVDHLRALAQQGRFQDFNNYLKKLKREGHSQDRIQSMMSRAMHGVKL